MAGRGRPPGFKMTEAHRTKIANSQILKRLIEHVEGKVDMSATQVTAGLGLLRKVMPDISEATVKGDADAPLVVTQIALVAPRDDSEA